MHKITFGRILVSARRSKGLSQRELADIIGIDFCELSRIENDRLDIRDRKYDWFVKRFCEFFRADSEWIEQIRNQTETEKASSPNIVFVTHLKTQGRITS